MRKTIRESVANPGCKISVARLQHTVHSRASRAWRGAKLFFFGHGGGNHAECGFVPRFLCSSRLEQRPPFILANNMLIGLIQTYTALPLQFVCFLFFLFFCKIYATMRELHLRSSLLVCYQERPLYFSPESASSSVQTCHLHFQWIGHATPIHHTWGRVILKKCFCNILAISLHDTFEEPPHEKNQLKHLPPSSKTTWRSFLKWLMNRFWKRTFAAPTTFVQERLGVTF